MDKARKARIQGLVDELVSQPTPPSSPSPDGSPGVLDMQALILALKSQRTPSPSLGENSDSRSASPLTPSSSEGSGTWDRLPEGQEGEEPRTPSDVSLSRETPSPRPLLYSDYSDYADRESGGDGDERGQEEEIDDRDEDYSPPQQTPHPPIRERDGETPPDPLSGMGERYSTNQQQKGSCLIKKQ